MPLICDVCKKRVNVTRITKLYVPNKGIGTYDICAKCYISKRYIQFPKPAKAKVKKPIDINTKIAKQKLKSQNIKNIKFGKIRRDQTRGVTFIYKTPQGWTKGSYSYLTDIPSIKRRKRM